MVDIFDRAQELEERHREAALSSHRQRVAASGPGTESCVDCAAPIPTARKRAYPTATRCIGCQEWHDRQALRRYPS